jgi:uncharacterized membrane protein
MSLDIWALTIVKAVGLDYPTLQLVFLRAGTGPVLLLSWILRERLAFARIDRPGLHVLRVILSTVTLATSFQAVDPGAAPLNSGLLALLVTVVTGTAAVIVTRQLKGTPPVVMMTFYTAGLGLASLPFALAGWQPVAGADLPLLLGLGLFAQAAQLCFLRAHWLGDAGMLGPVSYTSLLLSGLAGYLVFGEVPSVQMLAGAAQDRVRPRSRGRPARPRDGPARRASLRSCAEADGRSGTSPPPCRARGRECG